MRILQYILPHVAMSAVLAAQAAGLADIEPEKLLSRMMADGGGLRAAKAAAEGSYLLCVERLDDASEASLKGAKRRAQIRIAEFLGVAVSSVVRSENRETTASDGSTEFGGFFESKSAIEVERTIAGVQTYAIRQSGDGLFQAFLLSEAIRRNGIAIADAATPVATASKSPASVEVEALGLSPSNVEGPTAEAVALAAAKREAIEMVVGVSLAGLDISLYAETENSEVHHEASFSVSSLSGVIESYREVEKGRCGPSTFVRIRALVRPGKAVEDYRVYLEAIGSPIFAVAPCPIESVAGRCRESMMAKGMRFVDEQGAADWILELEPVFTPRTHPARPNVAGMQCTMQVKIRNRTSGEYMASVATSGNASDFLSGGQDAQRIRSAQKALQQAMPALEKAIQDSIVRQAVEGRRMTMTVSYGPSLGSLPVAQDLERLAARMGRLPVLTNLRVQTEESAIRFEFQSLVATPTLLKLLEDALCATRKGTRMELLQTSNTGASVRWVAPRNE